jgi:hypothetical protein
MPSPAITSNGIGATPGNRSIACRSWPARSSEPRRASPARPASCVARRPLNISTSMESLPDQSRNGGWSMSTPAHTTVPRPCARRTTSGRSAGPRPSKASTLPSIACGFLKSGTSSPVNAPLSSGRLARAYVSIALPRRSGTSFATGPGSHAAAGPPERSMSAAVVPAANSSCPPSRTQASMPRSTAASNPATARPQTMIESAPSKSRAVRPNPASPPAPAPDTGLLIGTTRGRVPSSRASSREARSAAGRSPSTSMTVSVAGIGAGSEYRVPAGRSRPSGPPPNGEDAALAPASTAGSTRTRAEGRPKRTVSLATPLPSASISTGAAGDRTYCPSGSSTHACTARGTGWAKPPAAGRTAGNSMVSGVHAPVR